MSTAVPPPPHASTLVAKAMGAYVRSKVRGSTRLTLALARRVPMLQAVPITINGHHRVYVDLRDHVAHWLLAGSPWAEPPAEIDEQLVMRGLVRPGDVVFDIGAHMGMHTVLLSELVGAGGAVHAFEANPERIPTLSVTVAALKNTTLHPYGLADGRESATLFVPEDGAMASVEDWTKGRVGPVRRVSCELRLLDDVMSGGGVRQPDFIKCDVEGCELRVFRGAARVLDRVDAPIVLYEANTRAALAFGNSLSAATDFLRSLRPADYTIFHVQPHGELHHLTAFREDCDHYNLVAVPRSQSRRLDAISDRLVWDLATKSGSVVA